MKTTQIILIAFTIFIFSGCSKNNENIADALTSKTWKKGLVDKNPSTNPKERTMYSPIYDCEKDDTYKFRSDEKLVLNKSTVKCDQNESQTETHNYTIDRANKRLIINGYPYSLAEESATQIKYYAAVPFSDGLVNVIYLLHSSNK